MQVVDYMINPFYMKIVELAQFYNIYGAYAFPALSNLPRYSLN